MSETGVHSPTNTDDLSANPGASLRYIDVKLPR